jgi:hypothetical protein
MAKRPTKDDLLRELEEALELAERTGDKRAADKARREIERLKQKPDV